MRQRQEEIAECFQVWLLCGGPGPHPVREAMETVVTAREAEAFIHHLLLLRSAGLALEE